MVTNGNRFTYGTQQITEHRVHAKVDAVGELETKQTKDETRVFTRDFSPHQSSKRCRLMSVAVVNICGWGI